MKVSFIPQIILSELLASDVTSFQNQEMHQEMNERRYQANILCLIIALQFFVGISTTVLRSRRGITKTAFRFTIYKQNRIREKWGIIEFLIKGFEKFGRQVLLTIKKHLL